MARLPYIVPDSAPQEVGRVLTGLPQLNIFRLLANADTIFVDGLRYAGALLNKTVVDPRLRELAILRVARLTPGADYEWVQHAQIALDVGCTPAQVAAVEHNDLDAIAFSPLERLVLHFTTQIVEDATPSDELFAALSAELPPREIVELVLVIGQYRTLGTLMATAQIDLDEAVGAAALQDLRDSST